MRFILVLEVNCISNLSPNHTLQLTTLRTFVRVTKTAFLKYDVFVVILLQMFSGYHICKRMAIIACCLIHAGVTSFEDA